MCRHVQRRAGDKERLAIKSEKNRQRCVLETREGKQRRSVKDKRTRQNVSWRRDELTRASSRATDEKAEKETIITN